VVAVVASSVPVPPRAAEAGPRNESHRLGAGAVGALYGRTIPLLNQTLATAKTVLLGARDPNGASCFRQGNARIITAHPQGGPGTRVAYLWQASDRIRRSPMTDLGWQQTKLKAVLQAMQSENAKILPHTGRLEEDTARLARALAEAATWPTALEPLGLPDGNHWPGRCAYRLDQALANRDLPAARLWSQELAAATFALADLHRWIQLLLEDYLSHLVFQNDSRDLYASWNSKYANLYTSQPHLDRFPGGQGWLCALRNLGEVEHQAEVLFSSPAENTQIVEANAAAQGGAASVPAATWMPASSRATFVRLRAHLTPVGQAVWDQAAHTPYEHSYLANMLFRIDQANSIEPVGEVLRRYEQTNARLDVSGMMDVLFYRGGDPDGGDELGDRFAPRLMQAAAAFGGTDRQVFLGSQHFTRALFEDWHHYGKADNLRQVLEERRMDCIAATDLIGALYRNAGRSGFYNIRLSAGAAAHSLAAARIVENGTPTVVVVDGLDEAQFTARVWPDAFFAGYAWPAGYTGTKAPVHAAELYGRGLDSYIWVAGYILRGPSAGKFQSLTIPYLAPRPLPTPERVQRAMAEAAGLKPSG